MQTIILLGVSRLSLCKKLKLPKLKPPFSCYSPYQYIYFKGCRVTALDTIVLLYIQLYNRHRQQ